MVSNHASWRRLRVLSAVCRAGCCCIGSGRRRCRGRR
jgi:hypothetical protein